MGCRWRLRPQETLTSAGKTVRFKLIGLGSFPGIVNVEVTHANLI